MVSKLKRLFNKGIIFLIVIPVVVIFLNICLLYVCKYLELGTFERALFYVFFNAIIIYSLSIFITAKYYSNKRKVFYNRDSKEKIIKPFIKKADTGNITSETAYISNVLNIMQGLSMFNMLLIITISYNIDESLNFISISIASIIFYSLIVFHTILEEYNGFCAVYFLLD